jgi:hypothetical protein
LIRLVNEFSIGPIPSIAGLNAEERMYLMIGTFWGDEDHESIYSLDYFGESYCSG